MGVSHPARGRHDELRGGIVLKDRACGTLRGEDVGREVTMAGWVHRRRDHGGLIFLDLRDRSGITQVVFNPQLAPAAHAEADRVRAEWVIRVKGEVVRRPPGTENPKLPSGEVEVVVREAEVLNGSKTPPFYIHDETPVEEYLRLRYRYLYLRRPSVQHNLLLRHRVVQHIRRFLDERGFVEIETPILIKSTPEGARDYLVPSRLEPGKFFALPQSPQQLKQLLMVAGFERYYQIARCFRDEDLRAERQPEFTQLDLEMSYVEQNDILELMEELFTSLVEQVTPEKRVLKPFPRLTYQEAMAAYGTDKPDLRFGLRLTELSDLLAQTRFQVFQQALAQGGLVKGFAAPGCANYSRKQLDDLAALAREKGARGIVTMALQGLAASLDELAVEDVHSVAARFFTLDEVKALARRLGAHPGDLMLLVAGDAPLVNSVLGALRQELGRQLNLVDPNLLAFAFVTGFPLLERDPRENRWASVHHPFTAPVAEDIPFLETEPGRVRSLAYDLVCNEMELGSGSIRIHQRPLQEQVFRLLGYTQEEIEARFGHLLEALEYGAPPHGGIAPGIDRIAMMLVGAESLREVIAFPKTQSATDLLFGSPSEVSPGQLEELHLRVVKNGG
ncbi:MAG: aspartate--tRNA ligase [Chloroflexi bacterium]|nr:aspartate--tRNA ligase [Chloroflexota bacterium]